MLEISWESYYMEGWHPWVLLSTLFQETGNETGFLGACLILPACCIPACERALDSVLRGCLRVLACLCVDWTLRKRSIEVLLSAMHTAACLNVLALMCTLCTCLQVGSCFAWVAMLKCGDYLPMANNVLWIIGVTPSLSPCDWVLVDSLVGPDLTH